MCVEAENSRAEEESAEQSERAPREESGASTADGPKDLDEFLPSVKLVYKTIEYEGPLTQKELVEATWLSARTVRTAVSKLERHDYLEERIYLPDARQQLYVIPSEE